MTLLLLCLCSVITLALLESESTLSENDGIREICYLARATLNKLEVTVGPSSSKD